MMLDLMCDVALVLAVLQVFILCRYSLFWEVCNMYAASGLVTIIV
jgi:hypothetical protein